MRSIEEKIINIAVTKYDAIQNVFSANKKLISLEKILGQS